MPDAEDSSYYQELPNAPPGLSPSLVGDIPNSSTTVRNIPNPLLPLIGRLETGGMANPDAAVSPTGAVGFNQIEPGTATQYGFDPSQLHDRTYNNLVSSSILDDLTKKYGGDPQAVLIAYNAGPGVANKWIASGRDNSMLPKETQGYLQRANMMTVSSLKPGLMGSSTAGVPQLPDSLTKPVTAAAALPQQINVNFPSDGASQEMGMKSNPMIMLSILQKMMAGTHSFTPVDYDPWKIGQLAVPKGETA